MLATSGTKKVACGLPILLQTGSASGPSARSTWSVSWARARGGARLVEREGGTPRVDDDEVVTEAVHLDEVDRAHRPAYMARRRFLSNGLTAGPRESAQRNAPPEGRGGARLGEPSRGSACSLSM